MNRREAPSFAVGQHHCNPLYQVHPTPLSADSVERVDPPAPSRRRTAQRPRVRHPESRTIWTTTKINYGFIIVMDHAGNGETGSYGIRKNPDRTEVM